MIEDAALLVEGDVLRDGNVHAVTLDDVQVVQIYVPRERGSRDKQMIWGLPSGTR